MVKLSTIKSNPDNPRIIKDDKFKKLVTSIKNFPKMMALRPMVVDDHETVLEMMQAIALTIKDKILTVDKQLINA